MGETSHLENILIEFLEDIWSVVKVSLATTWCMWIRQLSGQHQSCLGNLQKLFLILDLRRIFLQTETFKRSPFLRVRARHTPWLL